MNEANLKQQIELLEAALEFYALRSNHQLGPDSFNRLTSIDDLLSMVFLSFVDHDGGI